MFHDADLLRKSNARHEGVESGSRLMKPFFSIGWFAGTVFMDKKSPMRHARQRTRKLMTMAATRQSPHLPASVSSGKRTHPSGEPLSPPSLGPLGAAWSGEALC